VQDDDPHPIVPAKKCAKCDAEPVAVATETPYVTYYRCASCHHLWSEPRPPGMPSVKAIWDRLE
jgi:hypothetical protein